MSEWMKEPDWEEEKPKSKLVVFVTPTRTQPNALYIEAMEQTVPLLEAAGWRHALHPIVGNPYISQARNVGLRVALDNNADQIVFLDDDLGWRPKDLVKLVETEGDVVAGLYRCRHPGIRFMGTLLSYERGPWVGRPIMRNDGCIEAELVPAGFLKITPEAVHKFMKGYPELCFGPRFHPAVDIFNHGAYEGLWWGEDFAFSRRWRALGERIWVMPDATLNHRGYIGNMHEYLIAQPKPSPKELRKAAA